MKFAVLAVIVVAAVYAVDDLPKHHRKLALETRPHLNRWPKEIEEEHVKRNEGDHKSTKIVKEAFDSVLDHRSKRYFHEEKQNEKFALKEKSDVKHKAHDERKPNSEMHEWRSNKHRQSRAAAHKTKKEPIEDHNQQAHHPIVHADKSAHIRPAVHESKTPSNYSTFGRHVNLSHPGAQSYETLTPEKKHLLRPKRYHLSMLDESNDEKKTEKKAQINFVAPTDIKDHRLKSRIVTNDKKKESGNHEKESEKMHEFKSGKRVKRPKRAFSALERANDVIEAQEESELRLKKTQDEKQRVLQEKLDSLKTKWIIKREADENNAEIEDEIELSEKYLVRLERENHSEQPHHTDITEKVKVEPEKKTDDKRHKVDSHASKKALEKMKKTEPHPTEEKPKNASTFKFRKTREVSSDHHDVSIKEKSEHRNFSKKEKMLANQKPEDQPHKKSHEPHPVKSTARPTKQGKQAN